MPSPRLQKALIPYLQTRRRELLPRLRRCHSSDTYCPVPAQSQDWHCRKHLANRVRGGERGEEDGKGNGGEGREGGNGGLILSEMGGFVQQIKTEYNKRIVEVTQWE